MSVKEPSVFGIKKFGAVISTLLKGFDDFFRQHAHLSVETKGYRSIGLTCIVARHYGSTGVVKDGLILPNS